MLKFIAITLSVLGFGLCYCRNSFENVTVQVRYTDENNTIVLNVLRRFEPTTGLANATWIRIKSGERIQTLERKSVKCLSALKEIYFRENKMTAIKPGAFYELPSIFIIGVENNQIREIKKDVFNRLQVKTLLLSHNEIANIENGAFDDMPNLEKLFLDHNQIYLWYRQFTNSPNLKDLYLLSNKIKSIPSKAFTNTLNLQILSLTRNQIESIHPKAFAGLADLKELDLSKNWLKRLPARVFEPLRQNEFLYLSSNNFTFLPDQMFQDIEELNSISVHSNPWQCACLKKIRQWIDAKQMEFDVYYDKCIIKSNPVCVPAKVNPEECQEEHDEAIMEAYYKDFQHPDVECDDPFKDDEK